MRVQHHQVFVEWDSEAGAWVTIVPTLNGLSTFGETKEEALGKTREAILGYLEAAKLEGIPLPARDLMEQKIAFEEMLTRYPPDQAEAALQDLLSSRE